MFQEMIKKNILKQRHLKVVHYTFGSAILRISKMSELFFASLRHQPTKCDKIIHSVIEPFENVKIYKEMYGNPDAVRHGVRMPYISL